MYIDRRSGAEATVGRHFSGIVRWHEHATYISAHSSSEDAHGIFMSSAGRRHEENGHYVY